MSRGGKRPGAGRPSGLKAGARVIRLQVTLDQDTVDYLDKTYPGNRSRAIRVLVAAMKSLVTK